ncbi:hypothetical protein GOBAR_AA40202 [Gossypium barbadense]|uniref:PPM-type phosphatase domain-containing protein n=1 Tax=Gossypium barbadense TaxID=3634 RepID=A0A2P5VNW0_GOSBA|nr:hypothetical protein GOBAR_AA40202 [Gossypium barbadense]
MGNSVRKLSHCCSCNGGSLEMMMTSHVMPHPSEEFVGHSFCYVRPDPTPLSSSENHSSSSSYSSTTTTTTTFHSISGASVSANLTTVPLAAASSTLPDNRSSTFKSSELVAGLTLQPVPRGNPHCWSGPMDPGFLSGPIINFNKTLSNGGFKSKKKGKAGEDRTHLVVSGEEGWIFVGIYDGFSGPDAPDHLLNNLFDAVLEELKGLLWNDDKAESDEDMGLGSFEDKQICGKSSERFEHSMNSPMETFQHSGVLKALSEGLNKTEETYLKMANLKPELHAMGSCVLVMLMNGEDVYLMNVGDSRAILALKTGSSNLIPLQLTMDHNVDVEEEVERIRQEHPDDDEAVVKERVKGYLKVTRAFGAGFLKQPRWNDALYDIFRINYVGTSPYISSSPSLYHYKLSPDDKFLVLSSDGLYQYFTNQQVVSEIEWFIASFPDGDPAQHLVEQVLIRAAEKAGLEFHELVEIPSGERRMYHDDVSLGAGVFM